MKWPLIAVISAWLSGACAGFAICFLIWSFA